MELTGPLREASLPSDKAKNSPASGDYTLSMPGGGSRGTGFRAKPGIQRASGFCSRLASLGSLQNEERCVCSDCPDVKGFQTDDVCLGHRAEQETDAPEGCVSRV